MHRLTLITHLFIHIVVKNCILTFPPRWINHFLITQLFLLKLSCLQLSSEDLLQQELVTATQLVEDETDGLGDILLLSRSVICRESL